MSSVQRFGRFAISAVERKLWVDDVVVSLGARAFDLLLALIDERGRVVTKSELLDRVWPGLIVEENNLSVQISAVRKLLGPEAIATVSGRGYRFTLAPDEDPSSQTVAPALPPSAGPRTVVATDIVDSTALGERTGDPLWPAHDSATRSLIRDHGGLEIGRTDGILALFDASASALRFAQAYRDALSRLPVPMSARIGIHCGMTTLRTNRPADVSQGATPFELDGVVLPVAVRVMSMAAAGQILLTRDAASAAEAAPAACVSHGHWQLKGVASPVEVVELLQEGRAPTPLEDTEKCNSVAWVDDAWVPARQITRRLPADRTRFIGRDALLRRLGALSGERVRLVSLLGTGGVGKTRLACRFARLWSASFPGGAWFCDLSAASDADAMYQAVAAALEVPLGSSAPLPHLGTAIAGRGRCLLILDNAEQIAPAVAAALDTWMAAAESASFIVTSRIRLALPEEQVISVDPMTADDAAALFVARVASTGAELAEKDRAAVPRLVEMLDHLPLAIELAAARTRMMSADTMLKRIDDRSRWLAGAQSSEAGRPLDLRRVFDASWELLPPGERSTLLQLTVFEGGFDLAAAEAVVVVQGDDRWIGDRLQALVDHSMLSFDGQRFHMLRAMLDQVLAREIDAAQREHAERRHWLYFASLREHDVQAVAFRDVDNVVKACGRATAARDADAAVAMLAALGELLMIRGPVQRLLSVAQAVVTMSATSPSHLAQALRVLGNVLYPLGRRSEAVDAYAQALQLAEACGDGHTTVRVACAMALPLVRSGDGLRARRQLKVAKETAQALGDPLRQAVVLNSIGSLDLAESRLDDAIKAFHEGLRLAREAGNRRWEGGLRGNLGSATYLAGRTDEACRHYEATVEIANEVDDRRWAAYAACNLALLRLELGDLEAAENLLRTCAESASLIGDMPLEATTFCNLGLLLIKAGRHAEALAPFEKAAALALRLDDHSLAAQSQCGLGEAYEGIGAWASALPAYESASEYAARCASTAEQVAALCGMGRVHLARDDHNAARQSLARAREIIDVTGPSHRATQHLSDLAYRVDPQESESKPVRGMNA